MDKRSKGIDTMLYVLFPFTLIIFFFQKWYEFSMMNGQKDSYKGWHERKL